MQLTQAIDHSDRDHIWNKSRETRKLARGEKLSCQAISTITAKEKVLVEVVEKPREKDVDRSEMTGQVHMLFAEHLSIALSECSILCRQRSYRWFQESQPS